MQIFIINVSGNVVACGGLDNKVAVYPLSMDDDIATKKRTVICTPSKQYKLTISFYDNLLSIKRRINSVNTERKRQ